MANASFRQLIVWQRAIQLTFAVYAATEAFPEDEVFGLISQMRRATVSIASNIAEGHGRSTPGEFKQFLGVANGLLCELQTQLIIARGLRYSSVEKLDQCDRLALEVYKMLAAFMLTVKPRRENDFSP